MPARCYRIETNYPVNYCIIRKIVKRNDSMISKILFVEDTIALANIVRQELKTAGFSVLHTASGKEALRLHDAEKPDLVILDWMLPDIDGLNVLRTIRQNAATPVIMVTAKSEEIDKILGLEIGPTITSPSPSACASWWRAFTPSSAASSR